MLHLDWRRCESPSRGFVSFNSFPARTSWRDSFETQTALTFRESETRGRNKFELKRTDNNRWKRNTCRRFYGAEVMFCPHSSEFGDNTKIEEAENLRPHCLNQSALCDFISRSLPLTSPPDAPHKCEYFIVDSLFQRFVLFIASSSVISRHSYSSVVISQFSTPNRSIFLFPLHSTLSALALLADQLFAEKLIAWTKTTSELFFRKEFFLSFLFDEIGVVKKTMPEAITRDLHDALKYNLSFAGCGFLGIYHGELAMVNMAMTPSDLETSIRSWCRRCLQEVRAAVAATEDLRRIRRRTGRYLPPHRHASRWVNQGTLHFPSSPWKRQKKANGTADWRGRHAIYIASVLLNLIWQNFFFYFVWREWCGGKTWIETSDGEKVFPPATTSEESEKTRKSAIYSCQTVFRVELCLVKRNDFIYSRDKHFFLWSIRGFFFAVSYRIVIRSRPSYPFEARWTLNSA